MLLLFATFSTLLSHVCHYFAWRLEAASFPPLLVFIVHCQLFMTHSAFLTPLPRRVMLFGVISLFGGWW